MLDSQCLDSGPVDFWPSASAQLQSQISKKTANTSNNPTINSAVPVATVCSQLKRKEDLPLTGPLGIPVTAVMTLKNEEVDGNVMVGAPWQQVRILLRVQDLFCRHECMVAECIGKKNRWNGYQCIIGPYDGSAP